MAHSWFQHVASNESKHGWMDEGFTSFWKILDWTRLLKSRKPILGGYQDIFDGKFRKRYLKEHTRIDEIECTA
jgi:hypothetical protein